MTEKEVSTFSTGYDKDYDDIEESILTIADEEQDDDEEVIQNYDLSRKIFVGKTDREISSLHGRYLRGKLLIQPNFQRRFVWDIQKASRLIESVLLDVPLPIIYLSEEQDGRESVIDGQQRLTSFFSYIDGKLPDNRDFKLSGLRVLSELEKKAFKDIGEDHQDKISSYAIPVVTFKKESDSELKFDVFERLNTGAVALNDQELRNCIYRGEYNELITLLSQNEDYRKNLSLKTTEKRMKDIEYVLRFASFFHTSFDRYKSPMKRFMNRDMESYKDLNDDHKKELTDAFKQANSLVRTVFGDNAYKKYKKEDSGNDGTWEPKAINSSIYDVIMYSFAVVIKESVVRNSDEIRDAFINLMASDSEFIDSIEKNTSSVQAVVKRFTKWMSIIREITNEGADNPRFFSYQEKVKFYNRDKSCALCGNVIHTIDDAHMDHIVQFHNGGLTVPDNARLTHRFCNQSRKR